MKFLMSLITGIPFSGVIRDNIKIFLISFLKLKFFSFITNLTCIFDSVMKCKGKNGGECNKAHHSVSVMGRGP